MTLQIEVLRHDTRDALGDRIEGSVAYVGELCRYAALPREPRRAQVHICERFEDFHPDLALVEGPAAYNPRSDPPAVVVEKSFLRTHYPDDEAVLGILAHEIGHVADGSPEAEFEGPELWGRVFDATQENGWSYSAAPTYDMLRDICSEGLAEEFVVRIKAAKFSAKTKALNMEELRKGQLTREGFIDNLFFPTSCLILSEGDESAARTAEQFWDLAAASPEVKACTHDLEFYRRFVGRVATEKLYRTPQRLVDHMLAASGKHFF